MAGVGVIFEGGLDGNLIVARTVSGRGLAVAVRFEHDEFDEVLEPGDVERLADALDEWLRAVGRRR